MIMHKRIHTLIYIHTYPYLLLGIHTYPYLLKHTRTYPFISPITTCIFIYVIGNVSIFHDNDGVVGATYTYIIGTIIILFLFVFLFIAWGKNMLCVQQAQSSGILSFMLLLLVKKNQSKPFFC